MDAMTTWQAFGAGIGVGAMLAALFIGAVYLSERHESALRVDDVEHGMRDTYDDDLLHVVPDGVRPQHQQFSESAQTADTAAAADEKSESAAIRVVDGWPKGGLFRNDPRDPLVRFVDAEPDVSPRSGTACDIRGRS